METAKRQEKILQLLKEKNSVFTGKELASQFKVSRQVIVQDVAILRARGEEIIATPRGYTLERGGTSRYRSVIACCHTKEQIEEELGIIVDYGGSIIDVIVEHPFYGELKGTLMVRSRRDLNHFLQRLEETEARPLSFLTAGIHLHTVETHDRKELQEIRAALAERGFLVDN